MTREEKKLELIRKYATEELNVLGVIDEAFDFMTEKACEWLDNNLDDYLVIEENNYEGWSTENACYVSKNVYHDFRNAMQ